VYKNADQAVADIENGSVILSAGFGLCGTAGNSNTPSYFPIQLLINWFRLETTIAAIEKRGKDGLHSLTAVSNNAGTASGGGLSPLVTSGQIDRLICSFIGNNKALEKKYLGGEIAIELCPQGTIAERIRAGGAGIPAFFTPTGVSE
jgi:3-oxoacid CoA-transferase